MTETKTIFDFLPFDNTTTEQTIALNAMQSFVSGNDTNDFLILSGAAGTGKTSITSALVNYLSHKMTGYRICAPTGRAARILGSKTGRDSDTVHSLIYVPETNDEGQVTWMLKTNMNDKQCIYIIDEASMVAATTNKSADEMYFSANPMLDDLKTFVKSGNESSKIIFLGDDRQLPPIDEKESRALDMRYLEQKFNWTGNCYQLTEVIRQKSGSYILQNATRIRHSIDCKTDMPKIQANYYRSGHEAAKVYALNFDASNYDQAVCIGRTHKQNNVMNDYIRQNLFGGNQKPIVPGDMMIVNRNWSRFGVRIDNGDAVMVEAIEWTKAENVAGLWFVPIRIRYKNVQGEDVSLDDFILLDILLNENHQLKPEQARRLYGERIRKNKIFRQSRKPADDKYIGALHLIYGYSITCHKAQGGEWNRVYVNTYGVKDAKWMYTAVTRAKNILEVF